MSLSLMDDYRDGHLVPRPSQTERRERMLAELTRWTQALYPLRHPAITADANKAGNDPVEKFVAGLQAGLDALANLYDRQFADEFPWGSPYGQTLRGLDSVNGAHRRLMRAGAARSSLYEIVQVLVPTPGTVIAHVRRQALATGDSGTFSEMAMYVVVEPAGRWELVGGQNALISARPR